MLKIKLITHLGWFLAISLVSLMPVNSKTDKLSEFLFLQPASAQQSNVDLLDFLKCEGDCRQLPIYNRFRNSPITQRLINQLPKWSNICQSLTGIGFCSVAKTYRFKDGTISLKALGTEGFFTDIKFNSGISSGRAMTIARQSFNDGKPYAKTENLKDKIILYSGSYDNGNETIYLQQTYLILNSRNQVNRIVSIATSP